uniref:Uncharacterized protein n=1 Tax=Chrysotila carterae TaxID=13221 RepID=A0A7S4EZB6_CHRCT
MRGGTWPAEAEAEAAVEAAELQSLAAQPPSEFKAVSPRRDEFEQSLLDDFIAAYRNTLSYKSIKNLRSTTEAEVIKAEDNFCTFAPQIDHKSRKLDAQAKALQLSGSGGGGQRHERLYEQARLVGDKQERERLRAAEQRMQEYSFKPLINKQSTTSSAASSPSDRFMHLSSTGMRKEGGLTTEDIEFAQAGRPESYLPKDINAQA